MLHFDDDNDCGGYGYFQGKCFCNRLQKYYYQRLNVLIVFGQLLIACSLFAAFSANRPAGDSYINEGDSVKGLLVAYLCLGIGIIYSIVCCCGWCAIGCRFCPCLFILTPMTFIFAILLLMSGSFKTTIGNAVDNTCNGYSIVIEEFFNRVVDKTMCSDMCPCANENFANGGYLSMSDEELEPFGRTTYKTIDEGGTLANAMMFSRENLDEWLDLWGGATNGYS